MTTAENTRINKRDFISRVAASSGHSLKMVNELYDALLSELLAAVARGEVVVLTGFGQFYRQAHKGHKVRFGKKEVGTYMVLKFSASRAVKRRLNLDDSLIVVPDEELYLSSIGDDDDEGERERQSERELQAVS